MQWKFGSADGRRREVDDSVQSRLGALDELNPENPTPHYWALAGG